MGATEGGECDTEGTEALQRVCGKHPCIPSPLLLGDERFAVGCPPTPFKQNQATSLVVPMLRLTTSSRDSPL